MSNEKYPTWLEGHIKEINEDDGMVITLCSSTGNDRLEVLYYGSLLTIKGEKMPYIVDNGDIPVLVKARDPLSKEEFVIFDKGIHGYNSMFCDDYPEEDLRSRTPDKFQKYDIPPSKLTLFIGHGIDYDDEEEKACYEFDENGMVKLWNGGRMSWEDVKRDATDWITLWFESEEENVKNKQISIMDFELA